MDILKNLDDWSPTISSGDAAFTKKVNIIVTLVRTIGIMVSVITLSVIGIKFMLGSLEERAQYKQTLLPWLVGAILVFAITTIPTLIYEVTTSQTTTGSNTTTEPSTGGGGAPSFHVREEIMD